MTESVIAPKQLGRARRRPIPLPDSAAPGTRCSARKILSKQPSYRPRGIGVMPTIRPSGGVPPFTVGDAAAQVERRPARTPGVAASGRLWRAACSGASARRIAAKPTAGPPGPRVSCRSFTSVRNRSSAATQYSSAHVSDDSNPVNAGEHCWQARMCRNIMRGTACAAGQEERCGQAACPRGAPDHGVRDLVSAGQGRAQQRPPEP